ncbi:MAG TPA: hypothetical protein PK908_05150 [Bacteroidales bacterium]|nr:hypothetical protein [Bacteroidales bacterium]
MKIKFILFCSITLMLLGTTQPLPAQEICSTCPGNKVSGIQSSAFGLSNTVEANYSFVAGRESVIKQGNHHGNIIGSYSKIDGGFHSIVIGSFSSATNDFSYVFGPYSKARGSLSFALGAYVEARSGGSFIIGNSADTTRFINNISNSLMIGFGSRLPTLFVEKAPFSFDHDRTGRIGIGNVTAPQAKLHIRGDMQEDAAILLEPSDYRSRAAAIYMLDSNTRLFATREEGLKISTNLNKGITINAPYFNFSEGKVGIKTEIPEFDLDVNGNTRVAGTIRSASLLISNIITITPERYGRFANGTSVTPAYSFSGNNRTGMFLPTTNVLAFSTNGTEKVRILNNGNVGIGTNDPKEKLSIFSGEYGRRPLNFHIGGNQYIFNNAYWDGYYSRRAVSGRAYGIRFSDDYLAFDVAGDGDSGSIIQWNHAMIIDTLGNIGIGITNNLSPEKLYVNGNTQIDGNLYIANSNIIVDGEIHAKKFRAALNISWPDYVFDPAYNLPHLSDVEQFVVANRHLPGIPSAQTVELEGFELAEMNTLLLKKIEELTLYVIEQQKVLAKQQNELNALKEKMTQIENQ